MQQITSKNQVKIKNVEYHIGKCQLLMWKNLVYSTFIQNLKPNPSRPCFQTVHTKIFFLARFDATI